MLDLVEIWPDYAARKAEELERFCDPAMISASAQIGDSAQSVATRREYCDQFDSARVERVTEMSGLTPEPIDEIDRLARHPYRGPQEEFRSRIEEEKESSRSDLFTRMVQNAQNPDQLFDLMTLNQRYADENHGSPLWTMGVEMLHFNPQANLLKAQEVALVLYSCRRFGGCGPNQYFRLVLCSINYLGSCPPGTSVRQNLRETTPPATFELAGHILSRI